MLIDHLCVCPYCHNDQCVLLEIYSFLAGHIEDQVSIFANENKSKNAEDMS